MILLLIVLAAVELYLAGLWCVAMSGSVLERMCQS